MLNATATRPAELAVETPEGSLYLNRSVRVIGRPDDPEMKTLRIVRGAHPRLGRTVLDVGRDDPLYTPLVVVLGGLPDRIRAGVAANHAARLEALGLLVAAGDVPHDVRYACFLDEAADGSDDQVAAGSDPTVVTGAASSGGASMATSPRAGAALLPPGEVPAPLAEVADAVRRSLSPEHHALWVEDPATSLRLPYAVRREQVEAVSAWLSGSDPVEALDPALRCGLAAVGACSGQDGVAAHQERWAGAIAAAVRELRTPGYTVLPPCMPAAATGAIRAYYRALIEHGHVEYGDEEDPHRWQFYNDPFGRLLQFQLAGLVSDAVAEPVQPSFSYFMAYQPGADLPAHTDREQCVYTTSMAIDVSPDPGSREAMWPLVMETGEAERQLEEIRLVVGETALFKGREVVHYRAPHPSGFSSTFLVMCYVGREFSGSLQ